MKSTQTKRKEALERLRNSQYENSRWARRAEEGETLETVWELKREKEIAHLEALVAKGV